MGFPVFNNTERTSNLLAPGDYLGEIIKAEEKESKKGKLMWALQIRFEDQAVVTVFDYILLDDAFAWKMKGLCDSLGAPYDGKLNPEDLVGRAIKAHLKQQKDETYGNRNVVDSYIPKGADAHKVARTDMPPAHTDADLPF